MGMKSARLLAAVSLVVGAIACDNPQEPGAGMSVEDARDLAVAVVIANQHASRVLAAGSLSDPQSASILYPSSCLAISLGAATDADGDGIPQQVAYDIECDTEIGGVTFHLIGSISIDDNDDSVPNNGYSVDFDITGDDAADTSFDLDLSFDTTTDITDAEYDLSFDVSMSYSDSNSSSDISYNFDQSYSPLDPGDPFAAGSVDFSGSMSFSSDIDGGASESHDLSVSTSEVLSHDASCEGFSFNDGIVTYADDAGNSLEVIYNGCAMPTITFNGSPLSI